MSAAAGRGPAVQVVWLRRDLRPSDHPLLHDAARRGPVLPVFVVEPGWLAAPTFGARHWVFARACLAEADAVWRALGQPLRVRVGDAPAALAALCDAVAGAGGAVGAIWAAAEGGRRAAARDAEVAAMAAGRGIAFHALPADDVPTRTAVPPPGPLGSPALDGIDPGELPTLDRLALAADGLTEAVLDDDGWLAESGRRRVAGGAAEAERLLRSWLAVRGEGYGAAADDPVAAPLVGSRLGAHLAFGAIAPSAVHAALHAAGQARARRRTARSGDRADGEDEAWRTALAALGTALASRGAARQRFAARPDLEPGGGDDGDGRGTPADLDEPARDRLAAWAEGATGRPLIDAALRQLRAIGWLPFRLRAVAASYAIHDLGLPWPAVGRALARRCLDYDPAILWPAVRRIAGALDGDGPRIYNPDRQAQALDPHGHYVRAWLPALDAVPDSFVQSPWRMPAQMQAALGRRIGHELPPLLPSARAGRDDPRPPPATTGDGDRPRQLRLDGGDESDGDGAGVADRA